MTCCSPLMAERKAFGTRGSCNPRSRVRGTCWLWRGSRSRRDGRRLRLRDREESPFADGNKRVGFVVGVLFLELNGLRFMATETSAAEAVLALAAGALDESGYVAFLRENVVADPRAQD